MNKDIQTRQCERQQRHPQNDVVLGGGFRGPMCFAKVSFGTQLTYCYFLNHLGLKEKKT